MVLQHRTTTDALEEAARLGGISSCSVVHTDREVVLLDRQELQKNHLSTAVKHPSRNVSDVPFISDVTSSPDIIETIVVNEQLLDVLVTPEHNADWSS